MKLDQPYKVSILAQMCDAEVIGDENTLITGINEIHKVVRGDLMFVDHPKYYDKALQSDATSILINKKMPAPDGKVLLFHERPFDAYNALAWHFKPFIHLTEPISSLAIIDPSVTIEPGVIIGPYTRIGAGSYIQANTYIGSFCEIGEKVIIQPGSILGSDAFYFSKKDGKYFPWRSIGRILIQDDVEIGAGCTIVRGVSGDTIIGRGSKLDCQVHIGHGSVIGENCLIAALVAIAGKVTIGNGVTIYGQCGIAQNVRIGDHATLLAKTGVDKDLPGDTVYWGVPALPARQTMKQLAVLRMMTDERSKKG